VDGPSNDAAINELRTRQRKNFAAILLLSHGVPMMLAGDEFARTQQGNNNAYCQDNEISWVNWRLAENNADLVRFFRLLIAFRKRSSLVRRSRFAFHGEDGFYVTWHGMKRDQPGWDYESRVIAMQLTQLGVNGTREDMHFIANAHWEDHDFDLPQIGEREWFRLADTAQLSPLDVAEDGQEFPLLSQDSYLVRARSVAVFVSK
jgi:glycogen operon protein